MATQPGDGAWAAAPGRPSPLLSGCPGMSHSLVSAAPCGFRSSGRFLQISDDKCGADLGGRGGHPGREPFLQSPRVLMNNSKH